MKTAKQIVTELAAGENGLSDEAIAVKVGSSQPTIWRIRNADCYTCNSDLYIALSGLYDKVFGKAKKKAA